MCARYCFRSCAIAIRHPEAALQQIGVRVRWICEALRDPDAKQIPGLEVRVVQRVDVRTQFPPDRACKRMAVRNGREGV
jgi:hypothetical protein